MWWGMVVFGWNMLATVCGLCLYQHWMSQENQTMKGRTLYATAEPAMDTSQYLNNDSVAQEWLLWRMLFFSAFRNNGADEWKWRGRREGRGWLVGWLVGFRWMRVPQVITTYCGGGGRRSTFAFPSLEVVVVGGGKHPTPFGTPCNENSLSIPSGGDDGSSHSKTAPKQLESSMPLPVPPPLLYVT